MSFLPVNSAILGDVTRFVGQHSRAIGVIGAIGLGGLAAVSLAACSGGAPTNTSASIADGIFAVYDRVDTKGLPGADGVLNLSNPSGLEAMAETYRGARIACAMCV